MADVLKVRLQMQLAGQRGQLVGMVEITSMLNIFILESLDLASRFISNCKSPIQLPVLAAFL
jgi:hypothetical protein